MNRRKGYVLRLCVVVAVEFGNHTFHRESKTNQLLRRDLVIVTTTSQTMEIVAVGVGRGQNRTHGPAFGTEHHRGRVDAVEKRGAVAARDVCTLIRVQGADRFLGAHQGNGGPANVNEQ